MADLKRTYRVTIRYKRQVQQYEVFEIEASDLREAMFAAAERFSKVLTDLADLIEVRVANPAE
jgi:hypothetical protein